MANFYLPSKTDQFSVGSNDGFRVEETRTETPPLPAKKKNAQRQSSGAYENYPIMMPSVPTLPPKSKQNLKINRPVSYQGRDMYAEDSLIDIVPPSPENSKAPAGFLNPMYSAVSVQSHEVLQRTRPSSSGARPTSSVGNDITSPHNLSMDSMNKVESYDTDSIYFLEKHNPSLTKVEQYARRRSSLQDLVRKPMAHVYELCELKDETEENSKPESNECDARKSSKVKDIFDLVSFKSPLYGTLLKTNPNTKANDDNSHNEDYCAEFYDIPSFLPPSYPPPPLPLAVEQPEIPPRIKPPPVPQRVCTLIEFNQRNSLSYGPSVEFKQDLLEMQNQESDELHIYEPGPRDEESVLNQKVPGSMVIPKVKGLKRMSSCGGVQLCGHLYVILNNGKDISKKWLSLENGTLCCYEDPKADTAYKLIDLKSIAGVSITHSLPSNHPDSKLSEMWFFQIFFYNECHWLLAARLPSERWDWIAQLSLVVAPSVGGLLPSTRIGIQAVGEVYFKEGISGSWQKGFFVVANRALNILNYESLSLKSINLQHVSAIEKESSRISSATAKDPGMVFHLNLPQQVLYLQCDWPLFTESLMEAVQQCWILPHQAGLSDQYLTPENVPVVIDKCLKFVSTHGTLMEGIYRLSGSSSKVRQLLEAFSRDVWNVHLKLEDYSPHDVASALKRYLRNLPECLMTEKQFPLWGKTSLIENKTKRLESISQLLSHMPEVNYQTLKKLIGHLCMITEHSSDNLMPTINIAPVFGPTLMYKASLDMEDESYSASTVAADVVSDLITNYPQLFKIKPEELEKERKILLAVQKLKHSKFLQKPAGDILMGVYIYNKDWGKCINVKLTPSTTAKDVCEYTISVGQIREPATSLAVMEIVCNGELKRPLHYSERVLAVTMCWLAWSQEDVKSSYLLIEHNSIYDSVLPIAMRQNTLSVFGEMLFADSSSKSFKKLTYEFATGKLKIYKASKNSQISIGEWKVEDIVWYLGADSKRNPPSTWTLSFLSKNTPFKRSKSTPYFGSTICCKTQEDLHKLVAAMLIAEYPQGLQQSITLPDLLS